MSEINFDPDFVSRTKYIIEKYSGEYEFTLLLNCSLGVIVFLQERGRRKELKNSDDFLKEKIINISELSFLHEIEYIRDKNLAIFVEKLRNSIAHININTNNNDSVWKSVELKDTCGNSIIFSYEQLKAIILYLANKYLE